MRCSLKYGIIFLWLFVNNTCDMNLRVLNSWVTYLISSSYSILPKAWLYNVLSSLSIFEVILHSDLILNMMSFVTEYAKLFLCLICFIKYSTIESVSDTTQLLSLTSMTVVIEVSILFSMLILGSMTWEVLALLS